MQHNGFVSLVGAGPGDAELLTVKAVRLLNSAGFSEKAVTPDVGLFISRVDAAIVSRQKKAQASTRTPRRNRVNL